MRFVFDVRQTTSVCEYCYSKFDGSHTKFTFQCVYDNKTTTPTSIISIMPPTASAAFKSWLKTAPNAKLTSDRAVNRILYEGITTYDSLLDFDRKAIQSLPSVCKETIPAIAADPATNTGAEPEVPGANISSISVQRLIVAVNAAKYYNSIGRAMTAQNMHYTSVLSQFKIEQEAYASLKDEDEPKVPKINDSDSDRKIIRWAPIFEDYLSRCFGSKGPLRYVVREDDVVPSEIDDPLDANSYFGQSGSLIEELTSRLPHTGPIYRNDNATVYLKIEEAARGTKVESTIKSFARRKDGRGAYLALVANHAGTTKYRAISKKRMNFLQNIKWNGRSYPLESHVSNHRVAYDDLRDCANHITVPVPNGEQRVEYLIDSINCPDSTLQAALGLIRANTNNIRENFEEAASSLIEVDPYKRSSRSSQNSSGRQANISAIDFSGGRGGDSGVDLRWHTPKEYAKLSSDAKDELNAWLRTGEGKKHRAEVKKKESSGKRKNDDSKGGNGNKGWKKKLRSKMQTEHGLASVMSVLKEQETTNQAFVAALAASAPPTAPAAAPAPATATVSALTNVLPATSVKLASILKNKK